MQRLSTWVGFILVAVIAVLAVLNWGTLTTPAPIDLVLLRIDGPLGLVLLGLMAVLVGLFLVATLRGQIRSLLETRRLLKEIQRVQALADQAEASRVGELRQWMQAEFQRLHGRFDVNVPQSGQALVERES